MKVYTRTVIDMETLEIVESDGFDYYGLVAECGGSGGGGSSGKVSYPGYLEITHKNWLDEDAADTIDATMTATMNAAMGGASPYLAAAAFDPDADITAMLAKIVTHEAIVDALDEQVDWPTFVTIATANLPAVGVGAEIDADATAFGNQLDAQLATVVYPRFEAGMRDINAVVSSAFVIGRGLIEEQRNLEVAKYSSGLRVQAFLQRDSINADFVIKAAAEMMQMMMQRVQYQSAVTNALIETRRLKIVAKKEQTESDLDIDVKDATWDLQVFQYGANLMAAPGGASTIPGDPGKPTKMQSAMGGAMAGAAIGAQSANPYGVAIGAVIGGVAGYLSA